MSAAATNSMRSRRRASSIRCCSRRRPAGMSAPRHCDLQGRSRADALGRRSAGQSRRGAGGDRARPSAAGADYVLTPEMTNIMEVKRERLFAAIADEEHDPTLAASARGRAHAWHLAPYRLAGRQGFARQGGQPLVPDRPRRRRRRALRQDPHVRRRSRRSAKATANRATTGRASSPSSPTCRGAGSA